MALRFHGSEGGVIPRERVIESMRLMLERPEFADLVIPRSSAMAGLEPGRTYMTRLFIEADEDTSWVRSASCQLFASLSAS